MRHLFVQLQAKFCGAGRLFRQPIAVAHFCQSGKRKLISLAVGLLLIASLLIAHFWVRLEPLGRRAPLDVDLNLPLPWAGHASSVFSLTALFGAYLAILVIVGPEALAGVAAGGIASLIFIRNRLSESKAPSFEHFLSTRRFATSREYNTFFFSLLAIVQIGFAISELVILRDLSVHAFSMAPKHATVFAISVALVAYLYCLVGGYGAVFRTDILQFLFIALMCIAVAVFGISTLSPDRIANIAHPLRLDFWVFGLPLPGPAIRVFNFAVGFLTGACFLASSPDTWKRVFVVGNSTYSFRALALAGGIPFVLLLPAALLVPKASLATVSPFDLLYQAGQSRYLLMAVTLGMISAFLSSFDSVLISAVHILMAQRSIRSETSMDLSSFHYIVGTCFAAIVVGSVALLSSIGNSYLLAAILLSLYAIVGGTVIGTRMLSTPVSRGGSTPWLTLLLLVGWIVYIAQMPGVLEKPIPEQIKAFPLGMVIFVAYMLSSRLRAQSNAGKRK